MGCKNCPKKSPIGIGDSIEQAIYNASGGKIKSCEKCKKRRDFLNQIFPYNSPSANEDQKKSQIRMFFDHIKDGSIDEPPNEESKNEVPS